MLDSDDDLDLKEEDEHLEELAPVVELSHSLFDLIEKLESVRDKLDDFQEEYVQADKETRQSMELPREWSIKAWMEFIEHTEMNLIRLDWPV
jgi:hypothetical protein